MKKILIGFIAIGLLTFVGCEKEDDTEITDDSSIQCGEGATDIDGNTYQSVIIGTQEWMVENLKAFKYNDGIAIPNVTGNTEWQALSTGAWSHYDNQYDTIYGKLYNWYAVETSKLCPTGWHVPTNEEWTVLTDYLGRNGHSGTEGTALKATSGWYIGGWFSGENGTDDYGWLGLPGGYRGTNGVFDAIGYLGNWWSSSQANAYDAWSRYLVGNDVSVYGLQHSEGSGYSVRCLRD